MMKKIILCFVLLFSVKAFAQTSDSLLLKDNRMIKLSPTNLYSRDDILSIKVSKVSFNAQILGTGKPNVVMISRFNDFLKKNNLKKIRKVITSYDLKQGDKKYYIWSHKYFKNPPKNPLIKALYYEVTFKNYKDNFLVITKMKEDK